MTEISRRHAPRLAPWGEPERFDELRDVPTFDPSLCPAALSPWVHDVTLRMQCAIEFVAVSVIVALGSIIGRRCAIRPKRFDDWIVVANLWGGIVGAPGSLKSPALAEVLFAHRLLEAREWRAFEQQLAEYRQRKKDDPKLDESEPIPRRFTVNDSTVEMLGVLLNQNCYGLLAFRDELMGWLRNLEKQGREGERAFLLEAWNGLNGFTYDRISRGTLRIEAACVSVLGGIQLGPLRQYLADAIAGNAGADGLIQRFQLLVFPDQPSSWQNVDRPPDECARRTVVRVFEKLEALRERQAGGDFSFNDHRGILCVGLRDGAQDYCDDWRSALEHRIRASEDHPVLVAHIAKFRSLLPSLALIFQLTDWAAGLSDRASVSLESVRRAASWCELLEAHARRIYQAGGCMDQTAARLIAVKIRERKLSGPFTARDIYRKQWTGLGDPGVVQSALLELIAAGWLQCIPNEHSRQDHYVNPRVFLKGVK